MDYWPNSQTYKIMKEMPTLFYKVRPDDELVHSSIVMRINEFKVLTFFFNISMVTIIWEGFKSVRLLNDYKKNH